MTELSTPSASHMLMQTLEEKVKLLISQSLVTNLEVAQLQQEIARLKARLGEEDIPRSELNQL